MSETCTDGHLLRNAKFWRANHARILALAGTIHRTRGGYVTSAELLAGCGLSPEGMHRHLRAMERDGELLRCGRGLWLPGGKANGRDRT